MAILKAISTDDYFKKLNKENKNAIVDLSKPTKFKFISTGSWVMNMIIGDGSNKNEPAGFPRSHIVEIMGDESSGKTTLAMSACKQAQKLNEGPVVFADFERSFHEKYARNMGIDLSPQKLILMRPDNFQQGEEMMTDSLHTKPPLLIIDSVTAMIPREFFDGNVDDAGRIGLHAQYMSKFLSKISKILPESETCLILINQIRSLIKKTKYDTGPEEESTGGRALRYYSAIRLKLKKSTVQTVSDISRITGKTEKKPVDIIIKATAIKNRIDRPFQSSPLFIRFGEGFDNILSVIELGVNTGVIKKNGAYYRFDAGDETLFNAQGKEQLRDILMNEPKKLKKLQDSLRCMEDTEEKKNYKKPDEEKPEKDGENSEKSDDNSSKGISKKK